MMKQRKVAAMETISRKEAKEKGLKRYFTGKPCKYEHLSERLVVNGTCCECASHSYQKNKGYITNKYKLNREKIASRYQENKDKIAKYGVKYRKNNKDRISERMNRYNKRNHLSIFIRNSLNRIFTNWDGGGVKMEKLHEYTLIDLKQHIESQFKYGMSWENRSEWHIDHIKPIKAFLDEGITDPKIINALDNLQPLWAKDNLSKGAKYDE